MDDLRKVQLHCVKIIEKIDSLCRQHGIQYSLTGGSVIGAHLYNGFIPWDDDIDIMMTRENYDRFLEVCKSELPTEYSVHNYENGKDKSLLFTKIVDENTTIVEKKAGGTTVVEGIFVDVTVFDKFPRNKFKRVYFSCLSKIVQCCVDRGTEGDPFLKKQIKRLVTKLVKIHSDGFYKFVKRTFVNCNVSEYDYTELLAGFTLPYSPDLFKEYSDIIFEGKNLMIVKDYIKYLKIRYGKSEFYKEQQSDDAPHHLVYVDCDRPYKTYGQKIS